MVKCVRCDKLIMDLVYSYLTTEGRICSKCYEGGVNKLRKAINILTDASPDIIGKLDDKDIEI